MVMRVGNSLGMKRERRTDGGGGGCKPEELIRGGQGLAEGQPWQPLRAPGMQPSKGQKIPYSFQLFQFNYCFYLTYFLILFSLICFFIILLNLLYYIFKIFFQFLGGFFVTYLFNFILYLFINFVLMLSLDISGAYNNIPYKRLLHILRIKGFPEWIIQFI